jgi:1-phosphofructokinase family hexose kinase
MTPEIKPGIVTVTLNPAIDETVFLDQLRPGAVNRATHHHRQAGGKGVNVSSMLGGHGIPTTATGFLGRENPALFEELFQTRMIRDEFIRIDGNTRSGIKIVGESTTDINLPGLTPGSADLRALEEKLGGMVTPGRWFVIAGSLPAGFPISQLENILRLLKAGGAKIAADMSGAALQAAIDCGVDLIKPNHHELAEILHRDPTNHHSLATEARRIQREKVPHVILSLGSEGAMFASPDGAFIAQAPPVKVMSTVGAGDSMLAGYLAGLVTGMPAEMRAKLATVFAWSALEDIRRQAPTAEESAVRTAAIRIRPLEE